MKDIKDLSLNPNQILLNYKVLKQIFSIFSKYIHSLRAEISLGKILKKKKWRRSSYIVATKIYWGGR